MFLMFQEKLSAKATAKVMALVAANPNVEFIEENKMMQALATPNDTQYSNQWHYFESTGGLNLPSAWDKVTGSGVTVAVRYWCHTLTLILTFFRVMT